MPITFAALSGVLCERSGVVNIAIEGMLLSGAFVAAVVSSMTGNNWIGLGAAILTGGLLAAVLAVLSIRYLVNQIIAGTVINIFAAGITAFLSTRVLSQDKSLNTPPRFDPIVIPVLSDIPIIGPIFFSGSFFVYAVFILVGLIHFALFYTRYGLRVRSVGEHPRAADTVGINVNFTRYRNVILGGMVAGLGRRLLHDRLHRLVRARHDRRSRVHRPRGDDLRRLEPDRRVPRQPGLRVRGRAPEPALDPAAPPCPRSSCSWSRTSRRSWWWPGLVGRVRMPAADGTPYTKE